MIRTMFGNCYSKDPDSTPDTLLGTRYTPAPRLDNKSCNCFDYSRKCYSNSLFHHPFIGFRHRFHPPAVGFGDRV